MAPTLEANTEGTSVDEDLYGAPVVVTAEEAPSSASVEAPKVEKAAETNGTSTEATKKEGEEEKKKKVLVGMKVEAKDFYPDKDGTGWTQTYPTGIEEAAENDETAEYAILKRNKKSTDARKKFSLHSIIVQSPLIKKVLGIVFHNYAGITADLDRLEFESPFEPFVHRWEKFQEARLAVTDTETRVHLDLLHEILEAELRTTLASKDDLLKHGVITYEYLWIMFEPGTLVFKQTGESSERVMRVDSYGYHDFCGYFWTANRFVEWEGTKFGMEDEQLHIKKFKGTKNIIHLAGFPLQYHPKTAEVQKRCITRGRKWEAHCTYLFKAYKGTAISSNDPPARYSVDSRIIIDTAAFNELNPDSQVSVYDLEDNDTYTPPPMDDPPESTGDLISLTPYQLLLTTDKLRGYSLKDKVWLIFDLASVKEITWNDKAFSSLVLPDDTKDLVLAFAQSQIKKAQVFDDIIEGKGRGIIMLLAGPPGVGKTLTAEACSEAMKVPLYMMSAGDLGTAPWEVENSLKQILKMTTKWKAILLLDEADVFLEARSTHDLERNKLVSIFLRILEYFEGFLFLTSNRVDNIDAAFESRIHLSLQYGALTVDSRRQIWCTFLNAFSVKKNFTDAQIDSLAQIELNGRQIKNIIKTAQLLATSKETTLSFEHVQVITKLRAAHACVPLKSS
jgi:hypothetical protein